MTQKTYNTEDYGVKNLICFLEKAGTDNLMYYSTAASKKSTIQNILMMGNILSHEEMQDVRLFKSNDILIRYKEKNPNSYKGSSWQTCCSRVRSSLDFFKKYNANPEKYPSGSYEINPIRRLKQLERASTMYENSSAQPNPNQQHMNGTTFDAPIPIRGGTQMVIITGLPMDISKEDASKISATVEALATRQTP